MKIIMIIVITWFAANLKAQRDSQGIFKKAKNTSFVHPDSIPQFIYKEDKTMSDFFKENFDPESVCNRQPCSVVIFKFIITEKGEMKNLNIVSGRSSSLVRVGYEMVKQMTAWKPAILNGKAVDYMYTLPLHFIFQ